jgi:hypothetical protein
MNDRKDEWFFCYWDEPGFTQEEYDIRDAAEVLENGLNKEIEYYLNK